MFSLTGQHYIRRTLLWVITVVLWCGLICGAGASGFTTDPNAINQAAQSVLMLEVYNSKGIHFASGTGFVAFDSKTLVTNYHVIEDGSYLIGITDNDQRLRLSNVLCSNKDYDVAILRFDRDSGLTPLSFYYGNDTMRGQSVLAIGNPLSNIVGKTNSVSSGIISAIYDAEGIPLIQFTAHITHGSSGGALFNDDGAVIGVTSGGWKEGQDMNLAIRSNVVQGMYNAWDGKLRSISSAPSYSAIDLDSVTTGQSLPSSATTPSVQAQEPTQNATLPASTQWTCLDCRNINTSLFCLQCGKSRPDWTCKCGQPNITPFCGTCGSSIEKLVQSFDESCAFLDEGNYEQAILGFTRLGAFDCGGYTTTKGDHVKAAEQINDAYYIWGKKLQIQGDYVSAAAKFTLAKNYQDAATCVSECYYLQAQALLQNGQYAEASVAFQQAGDYMDAATRVLEPYYTYGTLLMAQGQYEQAITMGFSLSVGYRDTDAMLKQAYYLLAQQEYAASKYDEALAHYQQAGNYQDAAEMVNKVQYELAVSLMGQGSYFQALKLLSSLNGYELAVAKLPECYYGAGMAALNNQDYTTAIGYLSAAGSYEGVGSGLSSAYEGEIGKLISEKKYTEAMRVMRTCKKDGIAIPDVKVTAPGDNSACAMDVLNIVAKCGFITLIKGENTYQNTYVAGVKKLEKLLGLKADGTVYLSEMLTIKATYYPGAKDAGLTTLLEHLNKLNYILILSGNHDTYQKGYKKEIIAAEKAMGLTADGILTPSEQKAMLKWTKVKVIVGGYIRYGHYPQTSEGKDNTPIEWLVLAIDKKNNKALLLSRYGLDTKPYNTKQVGVSWAKSTIRSWLNGYGATENKAGIDYSKRNFYNTAFTAAEKKWICKTKVDNGKNQGYREYQTTGGPDTKDRIFLLSYAETWKYFKSNDARKCQPTNYAVAHNAYTYNGNCWWWVRSPGSSSSSAAIVSRNGMPSSLRVDYSRGAVRPAFWLDLSSDIIQ